MFAAALRFQTTWAEDRALAEEQPERRPRGQDRSWDQALLGSAPYSSAPGLAPSDKTFAARCRDLPGWIPVTTH